MKWGSLVWLCCAAGEIGRQPKPPLTEEQKRRRQQYVADKKVKRARQLKRMRWEVQQRRQAEREATAPLTSEEIERDAAGEPHRRWHCAGPQASCALGTPYFDRSLVEIYSTGSCRLHSRFDHVERL